MASKHGKKPPDPRGVSKSHGKKPPNPQQAKKQHGTKPPPPKDDTEACCPMVAAVQSVKRGKWRLARRYAAMSARLIAARLAWV